MISSSNTVAAARILETCKPRKKRTLNGNFDLSIMAIFVLPVHSFKGTGINNGFASELTKPILGNNGVKSLANDNLGAPK